MIDTTSAVALGLQVFTSITGIKCLDNVVKYDNIHQSTAVGNPRADSDDSKDPARFMDQSGTEGFETFPEGARSICLAALTIAAEGGKADISKPMLGLGTGVFEIALRFRSDAFRVVYALRLAEEIWVVHVFQKKSTQGIKTPQREIDLIKDRLRRLKEMLR
jgi:phage-related protein